MKTQPMKNLVKTRLMNVEESSPKKPAIPSQPVTSIYTDRLACARQMRRSSELIWWAQSELAHEASHIIRINRESCVCWLSISNSRCRFALWVSYFAICKTHGRHISALFRTGRPSNSNEQVIRLVGAFEHVNRREFESNCNALEPGSLWHRQSNSVRLTSVLRSRRFERV